MPKVKLGLNWAPPEIGPMGVVRLYEEKDELVVSKINLFNVKSLIPAAADGGRAGLLKAPMRLVKYAVPMLAIVTVPVPTVLLKIPGGPPVTFAESPVNAIVVS